MALRRVTVGKSKVQVLGMKTAGRRRANTVLAIFVLGLVLSGCSSRQSGVREMLGLDKSAPDEFLVVTKAPLTVPPNMDLRPPDPGAPPTAANNPTAVAEAATFGTRRVAGSGSAGEAALLASAGAGRADPRIRRRLRAENLNAKDSESTVAGRILNIQRDKEEVLDPEEERRALRSRTTGRRISAEDILNSGNPRDCQKDRNGNCVITRN